MAKAHTLEKKNQVLGRILSKEITVAQAHRDYGIAENSLWPTAGLPAQSFVISVMQKTRGSRPRIGTGRARTAGRPLKIGI